MGAPGRESLGGGHTVLWDGSSGYSKGSSTLLPGPLHSRCSRHPYHASQLRDKSLCLSALQSVPRMCLEVKSTSNSGLWELNKTFQKKKKNLSRAVFGHPGALLSDMNILLKIKIIAHLKGSMLCQHQC